MKKVNLKTDAQLIHATQYKVPNYQTKSEPAITTMKPIYEGTYPIRGTQVFAKNPSPYDRLAMRRINPSTSETKKVVEVASNQINFEEIERDVDYMKQLYPKTAKKILSIIEDECDRLDYNGSCIYDEYPDRVTIDRIIDRLYEHVPSEEVQLEIQNYNHGYNNDLLRDLIAIILLNEIQHRRRRRCHGHRGCRY